MENQKQPFASFEKIATEYFFKIHRKTPVQKFPFDKLAYLKPAVLLKKRLQHRCFAVLFFNFSGQLFLITSQNDYFRLHIMSTK